MPDLKLCTDCKTEKPTSLFSSAGQGSYLRPQCKSCTKSRELSRLAARRLADGPAPTVRCCSKCSKSKPCTPEFFKRRNDSPHGLSPECSVCLGIRNLEWSRTENGKNLKAKHAPKYKSKRAEYAKTYQKKNKDRINAYCKEWRLRDVDRHRANEREVAKRDFEKRVAYRHMRRAAGTFSYSVIPFLKAQQKGKCPICRGLLTSLVEVDHIMPIALGGTNESSNLQLLCRSCNRSKGAKHPVDFMQSKGYLL
jgi:5-methylcytosine-specific restriction endonuclease McrA